MKHRAILACLALCWAAGCGSGSSNTSAPTPTPANMQAGQWEFVLTPAPGAAPLPPGQPPPFYMEANLTVVGSSVDSSVLNTSLFANVASPGDLFPEVDCWNVAVNATMSGTTLSGTVNSPSPSGLLTPLTFSAASIAANGQSVSGGSYSADNPCSFFQSMGVSGTSGTFTGYKVAPVNGTYSGTLNLTGASGSGVLGHITLQVAQTTNVIVPGDNGFAVSAIGTLLTPGVSTNLVTGATTYSTNAATGAIVGLSGTATNIATNDQFTITGHVTQNGSQMTVFYLEGTPTCASNNSCVLATGTLTKQ